MLPVYRKKSEKLDDASIENREKDTFRETETTPSNPKQLTENNEVIGMGEHTPSFLIRKIISN